MTSPTPATRAMIALGALVLYLTCIFIPLGQHRLLLRVGGWWVWPIAAGLGLLAIALTGPQISAHLFARLCCLPMGLLYAYDFWLVVYAALPASKGSKA